MSDAVEIDRAFDGEPAPYHAPPIWTPEHVAHRMINAFEVLIVTGGGVGPRSCGATWPAELREFSDLLEDDRDAAREAFVAALQRPKAGDIDLSDEALSWPLQYMTNEPLAADAMLLWSFCKAGGFSIASALRARTGKAKRMAATRQEAETRRVAVERKKAIVVAGNWRSEMAAEMNIAAMPEPAKSERWAELTDGMHRRIQKAHATLQLPVPAILPFHAVPDKILSRASLDRYLTAGLSFLSEQLHWAKVPVR